MNNTPLPPLNSVLYRDEHFTEDTLRRGLVLASGVTPIGGEQVFVVVDDAEVFAAIVKKTGRENLHETLDLTNLFEGDGNIRNAGLGIVPLASIPQELQDQWLLERTELNATITREKELSL